MILRNRFSLITLLFLTIALAVPVGCADPSTGSGQADDDDDDDNDDDDAARGVVLVVPADADDAVKLAARDARNLLRQIAGVAASFADAPDAAATINIVLGDAAIAAAVFTDAQRQDPAPESFRLRTTTLVGKPAIVVWGGDGPGIAFGLYDLLEEVGFGFFHPEQTYFPPTLVWPTALDLQEAPDWARRGFHLHTMHPIEAAEFLMRATPEHERWAKNLIDWLVRNKQNYWQFELLRTADYDNLVDYYTELIDYSHRRGVKAGVVVSWVFQQQKAWKLLPSQFRGVQQETMEASIDFLMRAPWDHLHFEMGSTEFTPVADTDQLAWINNTVAYLGAHYPATDASVKVHCSSGQTADNYGGINFNYLVQEADERMGAYPHTVMYYDLIGAAPAYGNEDFGELLDWTESILGTRKIYYYPESAYWCSFDIDVPLFFPIYGLNRWEDIDLLADWGLDGHVTFTSGHEWLYWLTDWTISRSLWNAHDDWQANVATFARIFGDDSDVVRDTIIDLARNQEDLLIDAELASYLSGQETWDEIGFLFDTMTHPRPVTFPELYRFDADQLDDFEQTIIAGLDAMQQDYREFELAVEMLRDNVPAPARPWYRELRDSLRVNRQRAVHAYQLWTGAVARRRAELGVDPGGEAIAQTHFATALNVRAEFLATVREREAEYRYPFQYSSGWERSLTSYDYRYLWTASTGFYFIRYEKQAIDKDFNPFLMNLIDPVWFFF